MKRICSIFCSILSVITAQAAVINLSSSGTLVVPDNSAVGVTSTLVFNAPEWNSVEMATVELNFSGGWNGDLYGYLLHDGVIAILLNRPGRTSSDSFGFGSTSLVALLSDSAATDVHTSLPASGPATGTWQPDGRLVDPDLVLDTSPRTNMLSGFNGINPNGNWSLFIADLGAGDTATLTSWKLSLTVIPEPSVGILSGFTVLLALRRRRK